MEPKLSYTPATRADLIPNAAFIVEDASNSWGKQTAQELKGVRLIFHADPDLDCTPEFRRADGALLPQGKATGFFSLHGLRKATPADDPPVETVSIPLDVARAVLATRTKDGFRATNASVHEMQSATANLVRVLVDAIYPEPADVKAARTLLESQGYTVRKKDA